ncbi:hypothetical protein SCLCIDRAFT_422895 [Scleroderma citrinum Foug A]|uniref:Uncharacterized protein n=1 Tax=Scleroderma citrinum Foug A TaxID=1036808 RepID=A0A0C3EC58_9AGAM|nr:hypothetical protein SCLCIDRAFT_422895 [Scleroderma citrinum Foug A]
MVRVTHDNAGSCGQEGYRIPTVDAQFSHEQGKSRANICDVGRFLEVILDSAVVSRIEGIAGIATRNIPDVVWTLMILCDSARYSNVASASYQAHPQQVVSPRRSQRMTDMRPFCLSHVRHFPKLVRKASRATAFLGALNRDPASCDLHVLCCHRSDFCPAKLLWSSCKSHRHHLCENIREFNIASRTSFLGTTGWRPMAMLLEENYTHRLRTGDKTSVSGNAGAT